MLEMREEWEERKRRLDELSLHKYPKTTIIPGRRVAKLGVVTKTHI